MEHLYNHGYLFVAVCPVQTSEFLSQSSAKANLGPKVLPRIFINIQRLRHKGTVHILRNHDTGGGESKLT